MSVTCPKCGHQRTPAAPAPDWQCPACGIVYAKYRAGGEPPAPAVARAGPRPPMNFATANGIAGLVTIALIGIKGFLSGVDFLAGLLMIPFYLCFVSVVSYTFGDGLYLWNRWRMRFERFDSEAHPVRTKLIVGFSAVASVVFAVFLFFLPLTKPV